MSKKILFLPILLFLIVGFVFAQHPAATLPGVAQEALLKTQNATPASSSQEIAPEAKFLSPKSNENISGTINLKINVKGADKVAFFAKRQGALAAVYLGQGQLTGENQWFFFWDTSIFPNGAHIIFSEITNQYGTYKSQEINVTVQNRAQAAPDSLEKMQELHEAQEQAKELEQQIEETIQKTEERVSQETQELLETIQAGAPEIARDIQQQAWQIQQDIGQQAAVIAESVKDQQKAKKELTEALKEKEEKEKKLQQIQQEIEKIKEVVVSVLAEEVADRVKKEKEEIAQKTTQELQAAQERISEAQKKAEQAQAVKEAGQKDLKELLQGIKDKVAGDSSLLDVAATKTGNIEQSIKAMEEEIYKRAEIKADLERKILQDSDKDGLPDFLELELGTDPFNPDTSRDGYLDGEVAALGLDPRVPISALREKTVFQDPRKVAPIREDEFFVERAEIKMSEITEKEVLRLEGRGLPNAFVSIYIYSFPIIVTTRADEYGRWVYELDWPLEPGRHEAYVVLTSSNGEIVARSESFNFMRTGAGILQLIPEVWAQDTGKGMKEVVSPYETLRTSFFVLTISVIVLAISVAIVVIGFFAKKKEKDYLTDIKTKK